MTLLQLDEVEGRKWNVGVSVVMRITLRDGTFHEVRSDTAYDFQIELGIDVDLN